MPWAGGVVIATPVRPEPFANLAMSIGVGVLSCTITAPAPAVGTAVSTLIFTVADVDAPAGLVTV